MDSLNLIKKIKNDKYSLFFKKGNIFQFNNILLIISILINIWAIYMIFNLKNNLNKIKYELSIFSLYNTSNHQNIINIITKILSQNRDSLIKDIIYYFKKQLENKIFINRTKDENNTLIKEYMKQQNNFCDYSSKFINHKYEELLKLTNFSFKGLFYQLYVYKKYDNYISNNIIRKGKYEEPHMSNFLNALKYYSKKNHILNNKDIFILDIGGNIGAHTTFLGKFI